MKHNGLSIAGFILSFIPWLNVVGLILCAIGLSKAKKNGDKKGLAVAGLVISCLSVGWIILIISAIIGAIGVAAGSMSSMALVALL